MEFQTWVYVGFFLPITAAVYHLIGSRRIRTAFLSAASFFFYMYAVWWYAVPMVISSVLDYVIGRRIAEADDEARKRRLLLISVTVNLGLLSFFKYTTWLSDGVSDILMALGFIGTSIAVTVPLPPGISFYTFQTMSYTIDIYKGEFKPRKGFADYLSFVSFFPQLIAGPIERAKDLLPQLADGYIRPTAEQVKSGLFLILFGLFLKLALADNFGGLVDYTLHFVNTESREVPAGLGLVMAYAFGFQIYCDFSAYSNIARGSARLFGIELTRNFRTPYFAQNPSEFWQRWHITLSRWLRDYLYISLGGNRFGRLITLRNLMITMLLGGLWHGAGVFFILWGAIHGALLVIYRIVPIDEILRRWFGRFGVVLAIILFYHLTTFAWIFFRLSPGETGPIFSSIWALISQKTALFGAYLAYVPQIFEGTMPPLDWAAATVSGMVALDWFTLVGLWGLVLFTVPLMIFDYLGYKHDVEFPDVWMKLPLIPQVLTLVAIFYAVLFFGRRVSNEFIYFAF